MIKATAEVSKAKPNGRDDQPLDATRMKANRRRLRGEAGGDRQRFKRRELRTFSSKKNLSGVSFPKGRDAFLVFTHSSDSERTTFVLVCFSLGPAETSSGTSRVPALVRNTLT